MGATDQRGSKRITIMRAYGQSRITRDHETGQRPAQDARRMSSASTLLLAAHQVEKPLIPAMTHSFLRLQSTIGNRSVNRLLARNATPTTLQTSSKYPEPALQRQTAPQVRPASDQDRRQFVQDTIVFFEGSRNFFASPQVALNQTLFERLINNWYLMVIDRERMIDQELNGDTLLTRQLRTAYTGAIRVLISREAARTRRGESELYAENRGRIPQWAWQTPHHREQGISTPIAEGRAADPISGEVRFESNGFRIVIRPDTVNARLGNRARTRAQIDWGQVNFQWRRQGRQNIVTSFTGPGAPTVRIQTAYGRGVTATSPSGYGRGTTPADVAGGRVTPESTSLGFHEGSHGLDYVEFLETTAPPRFTGAVGMTVAQFQAAMQQWGAECRAYAAQLNAFSTRRTDCVGTTIDQFNRANAARGARVTLECTP